MDMNFCSRQEFEAADEALNEQWRKVSAHKKRNDEAAKANGTEGGYFQKLLEAQRAWLSYRDSHCEAASDAYRGGSIRPLIHNHCKAELTAQRTDQLQNMIEPN
ncbi:lysozyme inhibitor LprI family protein [Parasphingorhabdus sp.]|uniref:lysozyme inhibitor LprI family protein n=1 Tax=Parasphingorhabdus sp. TaxID=2709688 RepID=UPI003266F2F9